MSAFGEAAVLSMLRKRYPPREYAFFEGVPDATGFSASRTADALVMALWPSRGLELLGFEVKSERRDWLRELKDPAKAEAVCRYCDRWWIAAGAPGLVLPEELPPTWGLIEVVKDKSLRVVVDAPKLDPLSWSRKFVASLLRKAQKARPVAPEEKALARATEEEQKTHYDRGVAAAERRLSLDITDLKRKLERLEAFEAGAKLTLPYPEEARKVGDRVRRFLAEEGLLIKLEGEATLARANLRRLLVRFDELLDEPGQLAEVAGARGSETREGHA